MSSSSNFADSRRFSGRKSAKAPEKFKVSQTCNLLSKYVKENGSLGIGIMRCSPTTEKLPTTMDLFPMAGDSNLALASAGSKSESESARTYTSLALQTISKQFRCLKDTILSQIKAASKSLGEEEGENEGSRLKFVDHQIRQQKALQQLGMIQPNAWRPQRGLPERSVSVLRAWLFEHFIP